MCDYKMFKGKLFLIIMMVVLAVSKTTAQNDRKFSLGINGGVGLTAFGGSEVARGLFRRNVGYMGALSLEYQYKQGFSIVTGLGWERKGAENNMIFDGPDMFINTGISSMAAAEYYDYVVLPCLFRVTFNRKTPLFVNAGPYFGYLVQERIRTWSGKIISSSDIKNGDMGIAFGAGLKIPAGRRYNFSLETRFNVGVESLSKNQTEIKNRSYNLILGFAYNFDAGK